MAESQGKVVFDIDAQKAYNATKKLGQEFQQVGKQIASSVAGVMALAGMIDRATDAAQRLRQASVEANKDRGSAELRRGAAGRAMRLSEGQAQAYRGIQETGAVSEADQVAFMESLAKSGGRRVRGAGGLQYAQAFATGAFTQDELLEAAKKGRRVDVQARLASLSSGERGELALREYEQSQTRRLSGGTDERLALIERERQRRDNPSLTAFVEGVEGAPVVGGLVREAGMERLRKSFSEQSQTGELTDYTRQRPIPVDVRGGRPQTGVRGEGGP